MRVTIVRNTVAQGRVVEVGASLDLDAAEARWLVSLGKAVPAEAGPGAAPTALTVGSDPVVGVVQHQPAPSVRRRR